MHVWVVEWSRGTAIGGIVVAVPPALDRVHAAPAAPQLHHHRIPQEEP